MQAKGIRPSLLVIGGSGFVSGTLARAAVSEGYAVTVMTRGTRPLPEGVHAITLDRKDRAVFKRAIGDIEGGFDLVVDSICYDESDALQDIETFSEISGRFVFISTDSVYEPSKRTFPQDEVDAAYVREGYGGKKRMAELAFLEAGAAGLRWTILRPCHIYGPGSHLGCLPRHARDPQLVAKMKLGETLMLVGGGRSLQQPLFVGDLVRTILACRTNEPSIAGIYNIAGPKAIETRRYFEIIADALGVPCRFAEESFAPVWENEPDLRSYLCHRLQAVGRLAASGLPMPQTTPEEGLPLHVRSVVTGR